MRVSVFLLSVVASLLRQGVSGQGVDDCSDANATAACAQENRFCVAGGDDGDTDDSCGPCVEGFVEFPVKQADSDERVLTCINIDTELTLQDFLDFFAPVFRDDDDGTRDPTDVSAERLNLLRESARFVQQHNVGARNGTYTYTVGLNKFATDTDEEASQRLGLLPLPAGTTPRTC